ncbi:hypothetical protein V495_01585 [Pseudogymnoascus sp. VKM F-4514 (FW-929)]|nr:hypothetical protein V495_01585 [Pseudogymnoascus sp. VKM F-4514 (FW-929)]KFY57287.1 hypothetical protein V497_05642 [Pseudogymnoascus sp. VKM F-4516 (FW-969)]
MGGKSSAPQVVLADDNSPTPSLPPSTSDDPTTSTASQQTTSTEPSAQLRPSDRTENLATDRTSNPSSSVQNENAAPVHTNQLQLPQGTQSSRRRRREASPANSREAQDRPSFDSLGPQGETTDEPLPKRRRRDHMMRLEGDNSNTNGGPRPFTNGSAADNLTSKSLNGLSKAVPAVNGSETINGHAKKTDAESSAYFGHDREEVSRLLIQALSDLGYSSSADALVQESGYDLESPTVAAFRNAVLQGEWADAELLLFGDRDGSEDEGTGKNNGQGLVLAEGAQKNDMRFWLRQQKFLELLEARDTGRALMVLRTELTPVYQNVHKLHFLSSLIMCPSTEELMIKAEWDGAHGQSRHILLSELSKCLSPSLMVPEHRLAVLLDQVKQSRIANCLYHNTEVSSSLYSDHRCDRENFPLEVAAELHQHTSEIWFIAFSHDGTRLVSCGAEGTALIWDMQTLQVIHTLSHTLPEHTQGVCFASWSPDDSMLITCSMDRYARLWDTETGQILRQLSRFEEPVSSCAWAPDGQSFVTGCLYKERNLCQWNLNGEMVYDWGRPHRIQAIALSNDGSLLVATDTENHLHVYNFTTRELEYEMDFKVRLTSVSFTKDSNYILISKIDGEIRLFSIENRKSIRTFAGQKPGKFVIRSVFGGADESFVISGSDDGYVFIWHKENGSIVEKLEGHRPGCCNSVSWNPKNPRMFATAGDDQRVRIWCNQTASAPVLHRRHRSTLSGPGPV